MLPRKIYLNQIRPFYHFIDIKMLKGLKRCGKSTLLKLIKEELLCQNIDKSHLIYIDTEKVSPNFDLKEEVFKNIKDENTYYLFIDEIQNISNSVSILKDFLKTKVLSIFVTTSVKNELIDKLMTDLQPSIHLFNIEAISFNEIINLKQTTNKQLIEQEFNTYLLWGGLPHKFKLQNKEEIETYLKDTFEAIIFDEIIKENSIKDINLLLIVLDYLIANTSQMFSATEIINFFKEKNIAISSKTIYECLKYAEEVQFLIKVPTYDIERNKTLQRRNRYYLSDLGLNTIFNKQKKTNYVALLKNIVYNELIIFGYDVITGMIQNETIDFVASKYGEKMYIQVEFLLSQAENSQKKINTLQKITDDYPKYILSMDRNNYSTDDIIHENIIYWLLEKKDYL